MALLDVKNIKRKTKRIFFFSKLTDVVGNNDLWTVITYYFFPNLPGLVIGPFFPEIIQ